MFHKHDICGLMLMMGMWICFVYIICDYRKETWFFFQPNENVDEKSTKGNETTSTVENETTSTFENETTETTETETNQLNNETKNPVPKSIIGSAIHDPIPYVKKQCKFGRPVWNHYERIRKCNSCYNNVLSNFVDRYGNRPEEDYAEQFSNCRAHSDESNSANHECQKEVLMNAERLYYPYGTCNRNIADIIDSACVDKRNAQMKKYKDNII